MHMSHPAEREIAGQVEREVRSKETENRSNKFLLAVFRNLAVWRRWLVLQSLPEL